MARAPYDAKRIGNVVNIMMGTWLLLSTFLWPHMASVRLNTLLTGGVITGFAVAALVVPGMSWIDALPAWWLLMATLYLKHAHWSTPLNDTVVAGVVLLASLVPVAAVPSSPSEGPGPHPL